MCVFSKINKKIEVELHYVKKKKESNFVLELVVQIGKIKRQTNVDTEIYGRFGETTLVSSFVHGNDWLRINLIE